MTAAAAIELDMDLTAAMRRRKSLAVLQKIDPKVQEILFDCPHVAIYRFIEQAKRWDRLGVEGALFITRSAPDDPMHSLIVLNRRGPLDFILNISTVMKISLQAPYLMLLCSEERSVDSSCIFGIWVHDSSELQSIKSIIDRTSARKSTASASSSSGTTAAAAAKADRLLSLLRPPSCLTVVAADSQSDYPIAAPKQTPAPERLDADHNSDESTRSRDITAAAHLTSSSPPHPYPHVVSPTKRLLSILKKAPPPGVDGETDHRSNGDSTTTHETIAVREQDYSGDDNSSSRSSSSKNSSSSCRRAQLFSLMGLQQPAPPLLSSQSSDVTTLQNCRSSSNNQDREKLLRLLRPAATHQCSASEELLTDSQIARRRNVTTAATVVDEEQDKLQSLPLGKLKTSNNHADNIIRPGQSAAAAIVSSSTSRTTVKLISPSDLKAFGYR